jgi:hypothetical protein
MIIMLSELDLENSKRKNISIIYIMASRKYVRKSKLRKIKGRKSKRSYGKKRGGMLEYFKNMISKKPEGEASTTNNQEVSASETQTNMPVAPAPTTQTTNMDTSQTDMPAAPQTPSGPMSGGKRRRKSKKARKSRKMRKTRRVRKQRGGTCKGYAFQPSVVTPPNSALANPMPFASYNRV